MVKPKDVERTSVKKFMKFFNAFQSDKNYNRVLNEKEMEQKIEFDAPPTEVIKLN